jgi:hypothetical protein
MLAIAAALPACAEDLRPDQPDAGVPGGDDDDDGGGGPSHVTNTDNGDGTTTTVVDATRDADWVYLDLETAAEVGEGDDWDLAFQRFKIKLNGGVSGDGGMEVAILPGADFGAMVAAPADGWVTDVADGPDDDADPDLAFGGWYAYDVATHVLTPNDQVYVVRSGAGGYFKLEMLDYYDDAGTSAFPKFRWGPVEPPTDAQTVTVDASDAAAWVELDLDGGGWDLAFSRTKIRTHSGTSGAALGGARLAPEGATYEAVASATTIGYAADAMIPIPGPPGSGEFSGNPLLNAWYDYDPATHVVTSKQLVYLVRTASGGYAKLQIVDYADGVFTVRVAAVDRAVTVQTSTVAATDAAAWIYLDLRAGAEVTVADPATSSGWDVAISRTRIATNSGTSGAADGGAADPAATALDAVMMSTGTYAADSMLPVPGPPGSGEYSGNPVLAGWFDYNPQTHVVSPKDKVFLVRTADGGFVKLEVTAYSSGTFTIDWAYAGAGRSEF